MLNRHRLTKTRTSAARRLARQRSEPSTAQHEHGQALTEFLVLALALVPLFLLLPMIGKYQDLSHQTQMASRYAAFDAMVRNDSVSTWKPEAQLADEVRRRFFSKPDAPIKTFDVAGDFDADRNPLWTDPAGKHLIPKFSAIQVSYGPGYAPTHAGGFSKASDGEAFLLRKALELQARGVYTANVTVPLANFTDGIRALEPFNAINLSMSRHTSMLFDPWIATSPAQVQSKLHKDELMPKTGLEVLDVLMNPAVQIQEGGDISPPKLTKLDFWQDVVPADRLKP